MRDSEVKRQIDGAAIAIAGLPYDRWHQWAVYFLESLDSEMFHKQNVPELNENVLEDLELDITARLESGYW